MRIPSLNKLIQNIGLLSDGQGRIRGFNQNLLLFFLRQVRAWYYLDLIHHAVLLPPQIRGSTGPTARNRPEERSTMLRQGDPGVIGQIAVLENERRATETGRITSDRIRGVIKRYEVTVLSHLA